jgi:transposase
MGDESGAECREVGFPPGSGGFSNEPKHPRRTVWRRGEPDGRFTAEFKAQAVKRLLDGGKGLSEVATELGLSTGQLSTWRSEHLAAGSAEALAQRKAEEAETQRLRREVKRLEEENLILRKAAAVFAKGIA